ncbi:hypothetical protein Pelo_13609 [Pelomyxa schiedti]|nr:hypothetical protein Pelo_13609 [Pelomyxa schiedti]
MATTVTDKDVDSLHDDTLLSVFGFVCLRREHIVTISLVCRRWHRIASGEWGSLLRKVRAESAQAITSHLDVLSSVVTLNCQGVSGVYYPHRNDCVFNFPLDFSFLQYLPHLRHLKCISAQCHGKLGELHLHAPLLRSMDLSMSDISLEDITVFCKLPFLKHIELYWCEDLDDVDGRIPPQVEYFSLNHPVIVFFDATPLVSSNIYFQIHIVTAIICTCKKNLKALSLDFCDLPTPRHSSFQYLTSLQLFVYPAFWGWPGEPNFLHIVNLPVLHFLIIPVPPVEEYWPEILVLNRCPSLRYIEFTSREYDNKPQEYLDRFGLWLHNHILTSIRTHFLENYLAMALFSAGFVVRFIVVPPEIHLQYPLPNRDILPVT